MLLKTLHKILAHPKVENIEMIYCPYRSEVYYTVTLKAFLDGKGTTWSARTSLRLSTAGEACFVKALEELLSELK